MYTCRACLTSLTEESVIPFNESFVQQYNMLTYLNVAMMDGMPQYVCGNCADTVKQYVNFKERCVSSESTLQRMVLQKMKSEKVDPFTQGMNTPSNSGGGIGLAAEQIKVECDVSEFLEPFDDDDGSSNINVATIVVEGNDRKTNKRMKNNEETSQGSARNETSKRVVKKDLKTSKKLQATMDKDCGLCNEVLKSEEDLSQHLDAHRTDTSCKLCPESFDRWPTLIAHRFAHIDTKDVEHRCHICNMICKTALHLESHYLNEHYDGEKRLKCSICWSYYTDVANFKRHVNSHSNQRISCELCTKTFKNMLSYRAHKKVIHSERKDCKCDECDFTCRTAELLSIHKIRRHTATMVRCSNCSRVFRDQAHHDSHQPRCDNTEKVCTVCGKVLSNTKNLRNHMLSHAEEPAYRCTLCPKAFRVRRSLVAHMDRHAGYKRFKCQYCDFRAYYESIIVKHSRTHTGVKPYVCEICQKGFTGRHNLKVHMKVHGLELIAKKVPEKSE